MTTSYSPFGTGSFGSSSDSSHSSLDWAVTPDQRARAEDWLQRAYTEGRLTHEEFDRRMGMALQASTRRELNAAFDGIATIPTTSPGGAQSSASAFGTPYGSSYGTSYGSAPGSSYGMTAHGGGALSRTGGTGMGALAQVSTIMFPLVGPGVVAALSPVGTAARREAAKAFNSTLSAIVVMVVLAMLQQVVHPLTMLTGLASVLWVVFAVIGGVKASQGADWTNPFTRVLPLRVLKER